MTPQQVAHQYRADVERAKATGVPLADIHVEVRGTAKRVRDFTAADSYWLAAALEALDDPGAAA